MSVPEWLTPGAPVVLLTESRMGSGGRIEATAVDRVLKRDVVLANGERFNKDRLSRSNGTWDPMTHLLPPDDKRVERVRRENRLSSRQTALRSALEVRVHDLRTADDVRAVVAAVTEAGERLAAVLPPAEGVGS